MQLIFAGWEPVRKGLISLCESVTLLQKLIPTLNTIAPPTSLAANRKRVRTEIPALTGRFAAIDFETADYGRESACALSVVVVNDGQIVEHWHSLIQPPRRSFYFTYLHGISWNDVKNKPKFDGIMPEIRRLLGQVDFIAAHNASFDRSVLQACCELYALSPIDLPFVCTVRLARKTWNLRPANLPAVCSYLHIPLQHHDAESDAQACARILLSALAQGHSYQEVFKNHRLKRV